MIVIEVVGCDDTTVIEVESVSPEVIALAGKITAAGGGCAPVMSVIEVPDGHNLFRCDACPPGRRGPTDCKVAVELS